MTDSNRKEIWKIFKLGAPIAAAHLANFAMQIVDTMFIGRVSPDALGGVSVGNAVFAVFMIVGIGLMLGLDYKVSHAFGAKKIEKCHEYYIQGLLIATVVSIAFSIAMFSSAGFFKYFGIAPSIAEQGQRYLRMLCWSLWPFLIFMASRAYLQAMGVVLPSFIIVVVANIVNAAANWVLVFGHLGFRPLGVTGSGLSTVIARLFMVVALVAYIWRRDQKEVVQLWKSRWAVHWPQIRELLVLGIPSAGQLVLEVGVFAGSTLLAGKLGAIPLSAHQIVLHIASLTFMIPLGMSAAGAVSVGNLLGAGEPARAVRIGWLAIALSGGMGICFSILMFVFSGYLLKAFTNVPEIHNLGASLLLIAALFQLSDGVQVVSSGVLRGIGNTRASLVANFSGHWLIGLPIGTFLCFGLGHGAHGLWVGLSIGLTAVAAALVWYWNKLSKELLMRSG